MTPAALAAFETQRLATQYAIYGRPIKINAVSGIGCYDAARFTLELKDGGEVFGFDATVKVLKASWPAYTTRTHWEKKTIELTLGGAFVKFKIATATDVHLAGEWKLQLEAFL